MTKEKAIELAQKYSEILPANKYYVTDDEKVHTEAELAVQAAISISSGNPEVVEVLASELKTPSPSTGGELKTKSKK
jgi:hypothetical protein